MANDYGHKHRRLRKQIAPLVDAGRADCWRCGERIEAGTPWDLGHHMDGRYAGAEHQACNRATYGRERPRKSSKRTDFSRAW